ncbi:MAG TPA: ShlB/FhaC/HecB family hemolysin secretion/activation protein [Gammaproteobacteria bacterium]|nr:ShlB/FhaC/HecB family hemolysin secretion/activation protein [Gammaproteobacteria bacterium]
MTAILLGIITALLEIISPSAPAATPPLASVIIRGSSVYDAPALFAVYREQLGKPITADGARSIAIALIAKYEHDGYAKPSIELDDTLLDAGVLRIDVFEARISAVTISGDPGPHLARLESLGAGLRMEQSLMREDLQAAIRRMRDLPGLTLSAATAPDDAGPNLYRLDIDADFKRMSGALRFSNRGTAEAGPNFVLGEVTAKGLLGGRTSLGATFASATDYVEYHGIGALATVGLGRGQLSFAAFESRSNPHELVVDLDDTYSRGNASVGFVRPIERAERMTLSLSAGLDLADLEIVRSGALLRDERLRMLKAGGVAVWRGSATTQWASSVELVKGLAGLGSGLTAPDLVADPRRADFFLTHLGLTRLTRFGERWSVRLDALGQQTADVVPYDERFKIGGERLGRGYEVAEIAGDSGVGAKVEVRRELLGAPAVLERVAVYGFYDIGAVWKNDVPGRESAATAGVGVSRQGRRVSGTLELAQPLTHPDVDGRKDLRLFAELMLAL